MGEKATKQKFNRSLSQIPVPSRWFLQKYCKWFINIKNRDWDDLPETEFLDIILTKDSGLLLYAVHSPFYWRILEKTKLFSGFKNPYKKSAKQENSSLFMKSIL